LKRFCETTVAVEKQWVYIFRVCVRKRNYPARKVRARYSSVICGLSGSRIIFFTLSHKRHNFRKICNIICEFWFSLRLLSEALPILRRTARDMIKRVLVFMWSIRYSCQILLKLKFPWQIFEKWSNIKFHTNLSSESRVVTWVRTDRRIDRHYETYNRSSRFCECT
jgi:hypothetical protein